MSSITGIAAAPSRDLTAALNRAMEDRIARYPLEILSLHESEPLISVKELCLAAIYNRTDAGPLWVTVNGPNSQAETVLDHLSDSLEDGLDPEDYEVDLLHSLWKSRRPDDLAHLDTQLTYSLVKYIHDISYGQLELRKVDPELFADAGDDNFDPLLALNQARSANDLGSYLDSLAPQYDEYKKLRKAFAFYRSLASKQSWPMIGEGPSIRPGMEDSRLVTIRRRLALTEKNVSVPDRTDVHDEKLVAAVKIFQAKRGLEPDGIIGKKTRAALNRTPAELSNVIRANMIRMHIHARDLGDTYIMVNIAGFYVKAVRGKKIALEMPVIVGKLQYQTPVFSDHIRYLEFNPYWNIPRDIAKDEELTNLRKNSRYLVERHIRLFSSWHEDAVELDSTRIDWSKTSPDQIARYKLRQDPGPLNPLGRVKFVFPNHHAVYLHDTPSSELFQHKSRSFSHGCIRVSRPFLLAEFLLEGQKEWNREAIDQLVAEGQRKIISLHPPVPIHITYRTAWIDTAGMLHFNNDIYGRDTKLLQIFRAKQ